MKRYKIWKRYKICVSPIGNKSWWLNGLRHREDGPSIEYHPRWADYADSSGLPWHLNGVYMSESRHRELISASHDDE